MIRFALAISLAFAASTVDATPLDVYVLAGQSNAYG
jgi:hypothetical protein